MEITGLVLTPAYGKDYKSKKEVLEAWNANKDFMGHSPLGSAYVNKHDLETQECLKNVHSLEFRYKKLQNIVCLTV